MSVVLPLLATAVTLIFAISVLWQYASRRRVHQLIWGAALIMFAIGTGSELAAAISGWSPLPYQLFWFFGAFCAASYLGQGTIYLLTPRWFANLTMAILLLGSAAAAYLLFTAPIDLALLAEAGPLQPSEALPRNVRLLTIPFNTYGTVALVGGAVYSALYFWIKKSMGGRAIANVLIAVGTLVVGAGGSLSKVGGPEYHTLAQLVGMVLIFAGFLKMRQ